MNSRTASLLATVAALLLSGSIAKAEGTCEGAELVEPGKFTVAYNGDMPGTGTKDGKLVGIDGEIMGKIADKLGLTLSPQLMDWSAEVESVKSHRVDAMGGMMGWTTQRVPIVNMSDPIYYSGALMTQKKGAGITSLDQLKTLRVGTVQGFGWVAELKKLNPDLKLYDSSDSALRDLTAGRVDVIFLDPPLIQYMATKQPDLGIESIPVKAPYDPALPSLTDKYQVIIASAKDRPKLSACISKAVDEIWASCGNIKAASQYGFSDRYWFSPPSQALRPGKDRPADWKYPELGSCP